MNPFWDFCSLYHTFKPIDKCFVNSLSKHDCVGVCIHWMQRIPLNYREVLFFLLEWRKWKLSKLSKRKQDVYAAPEAHFLLTFFGKLFDCQCVLASSFLLFNKCITTARLALSHREKKMLYNAKIQNISLIYINKLKNLKYYFLLLLLFLFTIFADAAPIKVLFCLSTNINSFSDIERPRHFDHFGNVLNLGMCSVGNTKTLNPP